MKEFAFKTLAATLVLSLSWGCDGLPKNRPERKKLPALSSYRDELEPRNNVTRADLTQWPFYAADTSVSLGGYRQPCQLFRLPDPAYDAMAWGIVKAYEPLLLPLLTTLFDQGKKGIVVDLRQGKLAGSSRSDLAVRVRADQSLSLGVVLLWDAASATRANALLSELQSSSLIDCQLLNGPATAVHYASDCFSTASPGWE